MIDEELERAIDRAGRDRVFARARRHVWWAGSTPAGWILWGIVRELTLEEARAPAGGYSGPRLVVDNTKGALPA
jgi:hypothetical protein